MAMVTVMAGTSMGAQLLTGGNIPLVNNMVGVGVLTLDFSGPGVLVNIGTYIINNNSDLWVVSWAFGNGAKFTRNGGDNLAMTALTVEPGSAMANTVIGNLSTTVDASADATDFVEALDPAVVCDATGVPTTVAAHGVPGACGGNILVRAQTPAQACLYAPSQQATATVNYPIIMKASWDDASTKLAGLYTETVVFSVTATIL